jgi:hypothetical protein
MMATRPLHDMTRGLGRSAFDLPVAALAGVAVAVVALAMPGDLLDRLSEASGLPSLIGAAAPPLGMKARLALGVAGAGGAFIIVFALLRLLGREPARKAPAAPVEIVEPGELPPRLRRRDVHPDAPARRPISAARDLGEPVPAAAEDRSPPVPESTPAAEIEPAPSETDSAHLREAAPADESARDMETAPPTPPLAGASLDELMRRLEQGLARRRAGHRAFARAPHSRVPAPQVFPEAQDARLQSAIDNLQRLAARD